MSLAVLPDRYLAGTRTSHRWNELPGNFDRLNCRALFPATNTWGIPDLPGGSWAPARLVAYNDRRAVERAGADAAVHFFLDDYRFETVWTKPERGLARPCSVGGALTPDFSLWPDMPTVMQLWQVYRARWCGAWMAHHGVRVIPTISWSTPTSYPYAFAGIPTGCVVAVSTVGVREPEAQALFLAGYTEMIRRLSPCTVLVYGTLSGYPVPDLAPIRCYPTRWAGR